MADEIGNIHGSWKVAEVKTLSATSDELESSGLQGTELTFDDSGEVTWKVPPNAETIPSFVTNCEIYEYITGDPPLLKLVGTTTGDVIEFKVSTRPDEMLVLNYENCFILSCEKLSASDQIADLPFSFLNALEHGYFADLVIKADNGKEFKVHKTILQVSCPSMDWQRSPPPLSSLQADVLETILYYLYAECLPKGLAEDTAKLCHKTAAKLPGLERLAELCQTFLKNTALKQQIFSLISDIHACADRVIDIFDGQGSGSDDTSLCGGSTNSFADPAKLCYSFKQALREGAVAGAKFLTLCDLFSRRKGELSREERHEIIKHARTRLPVFLGQLSRFVEVCRQQFSQNLTLNQRQEIAIYLIPEIETSLDMLSKIVIDARTAIEQVITASNTVEKQKKHKGDVLGRTIRNALHMKELVKLRKFHERTTREFMNLLHKRENFEVMTQNEKVVSVVRNMEQIMEEFPQYLRRIDQLGSAIDEKLTWKEWKYLFKFGSSRVAWVLNKMTAHKATLKPVLTPVCDLVHRETFTTAIVQLGIMDPLSKKKTTNSPCDAGSAESDESTSPSSSSSKQSKPAKPTYQTNAVESLCVPPPPNDSQLAKSATEFLRSGHLADMTFEIIHQVQADEADVVIDHTTGLLVQAAAAAGAAAPPPLQLSPLGAASHMHEAAETEIKEIRAHRVIVAARCDWFRRALNSGMREAIDKKITVHDTNPELFKLFLQFLYSGHLDTSNFSVEQLADMMSLSDRYEVDTLKQLCEGALKSQLDEDTAFYMLTLADQFNARTLRGAAMNFVMETPSLVQSEVFDDLPDHLQTEVEDLVAWKGNETSPPRVSKYATYERLSNSNEMTDLELKELTCALEISQRETSAGETQGGNFDEDSNSSEIDLAMTENSEELDTCIMQLRDIVGDEVPREELVRVSLAADYDVNRALNFFFST
ncbi:uncharacterized protein [Ptychodera flava]|uniref:uncharacterized protein n=1 Tax=Ptychodera flava TaxID=63121 RepID=UPI00396A878C